MQAKEKYARNIQVSQDGERVAVSFNDGMIRIYDIALENELLTIGPLKIKNGRVTEPLIVHSISWHPEGDRLICGGENGLLRILDSTNGEEVVCLDRELGASVRSAAWNHAGTQFAAAWSSQGVLGIFDGATFEEVVRLHPL